MKHIVVQVSCLAALLAASSTFAAQDELMDKIDRLEHQIQELKALKEQQDVAASKEKQCMQAIGRKSFCKCVADNLPLGVDFEMYVHTLVTPKDKLNYDSMTAEQKKSVDSIPAVRDKCMEKGFFQ